MAGSGDGSAAGGAARLWLSEASGVAIESDWPSVTAPPAPGAML